MSVISKIMNESEGPKSISVLVSEQLGLELFSAYLYKAMAYWCDSQGFEGFDIWLCKQAGEENTHFDKLYNYAKDRGFAIRLPEIKAPAMDYKDLWDIWNQVYEHEVSITQSYKNLYKIAGEIGDSQLQIFIQWFLNEQVEEEKQAQIMRDRVKFAIDSKDSLLLLDIEAGKR